jgi:hypothetical protein
MVTYVSWNKRPRLGSRVMPAFEPKVRVLWKVVNGTRTRREGVGVGWGWGWGVGGRGNVTVSHKDRVLPVQRDNQSAHQPGTGMGLSPLPCVRLTAKAREAKTSALRGGLRLRTHVAALPTHFRESKPLKDLGTAPAKPTPCRSRPLPPQSRCHPSQSIRRHHSSQTRSIAS